MPGAMTYVGYVEGNKKDAPNLPITVWYFCSCLLPTVRQPVGVFASKGQLKVCGQSTEVSPEVSAFE
ncbi:hypothetical protein HPB48_022891 [Haemaphysalis longicornis]|uniref:Uncharacterized protein n=1 Tax=Haemaphysalis longicornis TaxID=44386 RepID=A0A9J6GV16_HAELO|nr:hypothetical protein HPB48_022891 [Haemaphysalis longicornis]